MMNSLEIVKHLTSNFEVVVNDEVVSEHSTEYKAIQSAVNSLIANPDADVTIRQELDISIDGSFADESGDGDSQPDNGTEEPDNTAEKWQTAYLCSWNHDAGTQYSNWGQVTTDQIKWDKLTHLIYFALAIDPDGTLQTSIDPADRNNMNADRMNAIVPAAHENDTKCLFCIGGAGNYEEFSQAIQPENRDQFFETVSALVDEFGFDGVDINLEPLPSEIHDTYVSFMKDLRNRFPNLIITAAGTKGRSGEAFARIADLLDQINIMSYDFVKPWSGWQAYHHTGLLEGSNRLDSTGDPFPSVERFVNRYIEDGVPAEKIGVGLDFLGYIWHEVGGFLGTWDAYPEQDLSVIEDTWNGGTPYYEIAERFDIPTVEKWDEEAQTSYLEPVEDGETLFVAVETPRSIKRKVRWVKNQDLGGVMIWGYVEDLMEDGSQPLLEAIN